MEKKKKKNVTTHSGTINITVQNSFRLVESYKALRTNLLFSLPKKDDVRARKILITSSSPGEGKTTTTVNLAITISEINTKVLLIDADMRKPTVHKYFSISNKTGLSNILSGMNPLEECVQEIENIPNLSVITSGILPPNPSELLSSPAMKNLLVALEENYDYIIIDTPPVNVVADALSVVNEVDGVALVISQSKSTYPEITKAVDTLRFGNSNIIGLIMNRATQEAKKKRSTYDSYSYKYKYKPAKSQENQQQ